MLRIHLDDLQLGSVNDDDDGDDDAYGRGVQSPRNWGRVVVGRSARAALPTVPKGRESTARSRDVSVVWILLMC